MAIVVKHHAGEIFNIEAEGFSTVQDVLEYLDINPVTVVTVKNNQVVPEDEEVENGDYICLLYTSPSPRDLSTSRMPSSA